MANMSYCRFENTASDLQDCVYAIQDGDINDLSRFEIRGAHKLLELARELIELENDLLNGIEESELPPYND